MIRPLITKHRRCSNCSSKLPMDTDILQPKGFLYLCEKCAHIKCYDCGQELICFFAPAEYLCGQCSEKNQEINF